MAQYTAQRQQAGAGGAPSHAYDPDQGGEEYATRVTGWVGWVFFAGIIMVIIGCFNLIAGFVALFNRNYYLVTSDGLMVHAGYDAWGWVYLGYGAVVTAAGVGVMSGRTWARIVGVILAVVNALLNLTFLAAYPVWSVIVIALDVIVIYALTVHGREARRA